MAIHVHLPALLKSKKVKDVTQEFKTRAEAEAEIKKQRSNGKQAVMVSTRNLAGQLVFRIHSEGYNPNRDAIEYKTLYKTAEVLASGKFYKVLASSKSTKEETDKNGSLLLLVDGGKQWHPIKNLHATL